MDKANAPLNGYDPPAANSEHDNRPSVRRSLFRTVVWLSLTGLLATTAFYLAVFWIMPRFFGWELVGIKFHFWSFWNLNA